MRTAYVGFNAKAIDGYQKYLAEPRAPSNYKDQAKIAEYKIARMAQQEAEAWQKPLTSLLNTVTFLHGDHTKRTAVKLAWPDEPIATYLNNYECIACIDSATLIRLARIDWIGKKGILTDETKWLAFPELPAMRFKPPFVFDPLTRLVGSSAEDNSDPYMVAKRFLDVSDMDFDRSYTGSEGKARLAMDLSKLLGM
jgi:hypothetical protein